MIDWDTFKAQLQTNPGKLLRSVLLLAGCFLAIWILVVLQSDPTSSNHIRVQESGRLDSLQVSTESTRQNQASRPAQQHTVAPTENGSGMQPLLPITLLLLICLGGAWLWIRTRDSSGSVPKAELFQTIGSQQLPGGQQLVVIKINNEFWIMTSGGTAGMEILHRYTAEEWQGPAAPSESKNWKNTFMETLQTSASNQSNKNT